MDIIASDVRLKSVRYFLGDKHVLPHFSAFWIFERQFPVLYISRSQFQNFTDSHSAPGHQFQDESVSWFVCPEDSLIDKLPRGNT